MTTKPLTYPDPSGALSPNGNTIQSTWVKLLLEDWDPHEAGLQKLRTCCDAVPADACRSYILNGVFGDRCRSHKTPAASALSIYNTRRNTTVLEYVTGKDGGGFERRYTLAVFFAKLFPNNDEGTRIACEVEAAQGFLKLCEAGHLGFGLLMAPRRMSMGISGVAGAVDPTRTLLAYIAYPSQKLTEHFYADPPDNTYGAICEFLNRKMSFVGFVPEDEVATADDWPQVVSGPR